MNTPCRIVTAGDAAVIVEFDERIDTVVNARAIAMADAVERASFPGVRDVVPAYRSVAVYFDPLQTDTSGLLERLGDLADAVPASATSGGATVRVPVCYGGEFGPDLPDVARFAQLSEDETARLHAAGAYRVFMLGFLPGFAYLGPVPPQLAVPRRPVPRARVAAGSVAIAGGQTAVYPFETPGGWQVIGRTPLKPFDAGRDSACLFSPGDRVEFYAIERGEFDTFTDSVRRPV